MHTTLRKTWLQRACVVLCTSLLLAGCGLAGGQASVATGTKYQNEGKYRAAYIEAKKVLQKDSRNGQAWLLLGQASLMLGDPKDAQSDLENAKANGVAEADWIVPLGRALMVTAQFDTLLKTLPATNTFAPAVGADVATLRGDAQRALKQDAAAQASYEAALKLEPKQANALVGLAKLAAESKDTATAQKYIAQALAAAPASPQALVAKADLAFEGGDFATAEAAYQQSLDLKHADWLPQERFYAQARLADTQARQNQFDAALKNIAELEKLSPQQPYPHYLHATVLYKQGHLDGAIEQLQDVLKASANNVPAQLLMGAVNYAKGDYSQAEMYLSNVMGVDPQNASARKLLALTFFREGRSQQALGTLRPLVPNNPTDAELLAMLQRAATEGVGTPKGEVATATGTPAPLAASSGPYAQAGSALAGGNNAEAIRLLENTPAKNESEAAQRATLLVMAYVRDKQPAKAVKIAADYAAKHPTDSAAFLVYGTALVAANQRDAARKQYDQAIKLDPKNIGALLSLASLDVVEGHAKDAEARYATVLQQDPKNAAAMLALGRLAAQRGDQADAIKRFQQAIDAQPQAPAGYVELALLYSQTGRFDQAAATAKRLADAEPNNPAALNAYGAAELNAGRHAEALAPLQQAVKLAPTMALFRTNLARAQILNKDAADARTNLEAVVKTNPAEVQAVALLAFMQMQNHDLAGAVALAQTLQKQPTVKAQGFALEGDLYMADKAYTKAASAYQQGLKVSYDRPLVIKSFQAAEAAKAKQPEAILTGWLAKHADDGGVRLLLAQYYMDQQQNAQAATQYEAVLKQSPGNVDALNNLAWIYDTQHNPKAVELSARAYKLQPTSPAVADTYGWALVNANQAKTAVPVLAAAAKAAPTVGTIQYHYAVAQARAGDKAGARATLGALQKAGTAFSERAAADKLYAELGGANAK
ncbi:MAG TPA: XrtA/PEP-CTERM system TPR-repeat protein PrsT [Rhodanobacteraceae bacterium]|nr:XrtA/PEP-CTERM system TPR-repeat protein PrsT [Rhodanobacteraceae bacterium]